MGLHKTGSSSIQQTSHKNSDLLKNNGLLYPELNNSNHSVAFYSKFSNKRLTYHINTRQNLKIEDINKINKECFSRLSKEINETDCDKVLISGEDISVLTEEELCSLKGWFESNIIADLEFEIIVYIRNPIDWTSSNIQELVKNGIKNIHQAHELGYLQCIKEKVLMLSNVFGNEKIKTLIFEDECKKEGGLITSFYSHLGIDKSIINEIKACRANESLSLDELFIYSIYNDLVKSTGFTHRFICQLSSNFKHTSFFLTDNFKDKINSESKADKEFIRYLGLNVLKPIRHPKIGFMILSNLSELEHNVSLLASTFDVDKADLFRNFALLYEVYSLERAFQLMQLASKYRPLGPLIKNKILSYTSKLSIEGYFDDELGFIWVERK